jgi:hypothetical protein
MVGLRYYIHCSHHVIYDAYVKVEWLCNSVLYDLLFWDIPEIYDGNILKCYFPI